MRLIHHFQLTWRQWRMALAAVVVIGVAVGVGAGVWLRVADSGRQGVVQPAGQPSGRAAILPSPAPSAALPGSGPADPTATVRIAAAGDIACPTTSSDYRGGRGTDERCRQRATSDLLIRDGAAAAGDRLDAVLPLGDLQYEDGTAEAFATAYDPTWGRVKALTRPAIGNHEYHSDGRAYFDYFGAAAGTPGEGWYSYDLGAWHLIALNSNCDRVDCSETSAQLTWLRADLRAHPARCVLAYWHHPRWSGGRHGDNGAVAPFVRELYAAGADVILAGHDHGYERFVPRAPDGAIDPARGIREFVVGTGGKSFYRIVPSEFTQAYTDSTFGVLDLTLRPTGYDWSFRPIAGQRYTDAGSAGCH